jgi:hypothetical protein
MKFGHCKLTGNKGAFVKSHLIPEALTRPELPGMPFIEAGEGGRPTRRYTSWYDSELVTQVGENILSGYDNWAISELRRHKLIWSSWESIESLSPPDWTPVSLDGPTGHGIRTIACTDPDKFRLFFLSVLWRAAATKRPEFHQVAIEKVALERLTAMVRDGNPDPLEFYPVKLVQILSRGPIHNFAPLAEDSMMDLGHPQLWRHYVFRFYFDGLIVLMHRPRPPGEMPDFGKLVVGFSSELAVQTIPSGGSRQLQNLAKLREDAQRQWPDNMFRLGK